jgi:aminopeptidase N/puromycin-sensitive aminopeptidase
MKISFLASSLRATVAAAAAVVCLFVAPAQQADAQRLPTIVKPEHYALALTPDLKAATFAGVETIDVTIGEPTDRITLNAAEIAFQSVAISAGGATRSATVSLDKDKEQATFTFPAKLPAGKATLSIVYTGILNNELRGFYLSKTARRNYAVTQFEATDARRAFPSFDEPAFKATYDVSLTIDAGDTALSNGPIVADAPGPGEGKHTLRFDTTPKMSTYLVAFLVGDFECTAGEQDGVAIRVCSTPDKVAMTSYGVGIAKYVLHYYNTYFGIPYPLKKLDLIGLPDFEAGAMENFGCITYRETDLLIDEKIASVGSKKRVAVVIAHEMAHQWFGDLVTMQWWDNLWLNEGFATWMENKAVATMHPEWNFEEVEAQGVDGALDLDAQPTTRAIRAKADTPDEINEMFDGIAYGKAGDVLLTVENYLGAETFRKGVHAYLSAHLYANATAEDFWGAQTAVSHKPVDKIMESLVAQPGAPILTFGEPAGGKVEVAQKRFYLSPGIKADPAQKWTLPVCFKTGAAGKPYVIPAPQPRAAPHSANASQSDSAAQSTAPVHLPATVAAIGNPYGSNSQECEVLTPADSTLTVPAAGLFFANAGGKGYYRSAYPPSVYSALVANVETGLTPTERISLLGDEWAQVRADKATVGDYMNLVAAVKADPGAEVLTEALGGVNIVVERVAATEEERTALGAWIRSTFAPEFAWLGPPAESDSANTRELRAQLFGVLGYYGKDPAVIAQARQMTEKFLTDPTSVEPTMGQTAAFIAARNGDAALFDKLQKIYETTTNPEFQEGALELLSQFQDPALIERSLDYTASGKVRNQDVAREFAAALQTQESRDLAWKYIQNHWDKVQSQLTTNSGAELVGSTSGFCTAAGRDEMKSFFAAHKVPSSEMALKHAVERIDGCIELRALQEPSLKQWLATLPKP